MALIDSITSRASSVATRGLQLAQRGADQLPDVARNIGRDVFPAGTGKRLAVGVARNINSRVQQRITQAAINYTPYGKALQAAQFAWQHRDEIKKVSVVVIAGAVTFVVLLVTAALNLMDTMQNQPLTAVDSIVRVALGRPLSEEIGNKICENIKERPGMEVNTINCDQVAKLTNAQGISPN